MCADIFPTHFTGKSWSSATYPDHTWDQSRDNVVTPMTHLFLTTKVDEQVFDVGGSALLHVTRTGKAVTLVNLSLYEPETAFNYMNEIFFMLTLPELDEYFRCPSTKQLKEEFIFVVDNGSSEARSNMAVKMCMARLVNVLKIKKCVQVLYAEYHSKLNPAE